ncbi:MAG: hypothetical protein HYR55_09360 [Acidobacteria bacterium]|nr:hypothetical protein [Acidobacteriota bacterium]MBI3657697.1 hypothetical protein [Acidobacteriota bacterium]
MPTNKVLIRNKPRIFSPNSPIGPDAKRRFGWDAHTHSQPGRHNASTRELLVKIRYGLLVLLLGMTFTALGLSQECVDRYPRFGELYSDPFSVPQRVTYILGGRHPVQGYLFFAYCRDSFQQVVMDLNYEVVWNFYTEPRPPEEAECPTAEGQPYRAAVQRWLVERPGCGILQGLVCGSKGFLTRVSEYLYTRDLPMGQQIFPMGGITDVAMLYEPDTQYVRGLVSMGCPGEACAILDAFYGQVRNAAVMDSLRYDEWGRPLFALFDSGQVPYDRRLNDPDVPIQWRRWFEAALQSCYSAPVSQ